MMMDNYEYVRNPVHYTSSRYEPKDVIRDWNLNYNLGSVVKYISRAGKKPGNSKLQDLRKAAEFLRFEIEAIVEEENKNDTGYQE